MKTIAYLLRTYLIDSLLAQAPLGATSWPAYLQTLPDGNGIRDDAIMLRDSIGNKDGRLMGGSTIIHEGGTIVVRSKEYANGWDEMNDIAVACDSILNEDISISSGEIYRIHAVSRFPIMPLGVEPGTKRRWMFEMRIAASLSLLS